MKASLLFTKSFWNTTRNCEKKVILIFQFWQNVFDIICMIWLRQKVLLSFLMQTCWQTRKQVFLPETPSHIDNPHMSFVTYQDDNNQQGCACFLLVAHTCQITISPVSITWRTPWGGGVDLWVEGICDTR